MSVRQTVVSTYHTQVELAAFPFASEAALKLGTTELTLKLESNTGKLWRAAETQLIGESPAMSLDELGAMRDWAWFDGVTSDSITLAQLLRTTSKRYLVADGAVARPRQPDSVNPTRQDSVAARAAWRWMSFALPPDLLLAGLSEPRRPGGVDAVSPSLAAHLQLNGFAETHVHKGAAMAFDVLWASGLHAIAASGMKEHAFGSPGAACNEGEDLAPWLLRAAIARYLLGSYLTNPALTLTDWLNEFRSQLEKTRGRIVVSAVLDQALEDLCAGRLTKAPEGPRFANLQNLYADITQVRTACRSPSGESQAAALTPADWERRAFRLDPLHRLVPSSGSWSSPEFWFVCAALRHLENRAPPADPLFERLFWQVIRIRCLVYRHVVQRPMTPGLQWFLRVYERLKPLRRGLRADLGPLGTASALNVSGIGQGLRSLELRVAPENTVQENLADLRMDERLNCASDSVSELFASPPLPTSKPREPTPQIGYLFHFIRNRGNLDKGKQPAYWKGCAGDPGYEPGKPKDGNPSGYRFARYYGARRREALVLARTLTSFPVTLEVFRGVDLCTDEVGIPIWVVAPLVRYVCDASKLASLASHRRRGATARPFRRAVHAGEDFVHLLSGMRRLHESIEHLCLSEGDRIGHGLALGLDPELWARRAGRIAMPREQRLLDLVWAWSWMTRGKVPSTSAIAVEQEIRRHAAAVFVDNRRLVESRKRLEPADIAELVTDLHNEERLRAAGFPSGYRRHEQDSDPRMNLLVRYLTDDQVFSQGNETVWVDPAPEAQLLSQIQEKMRSEVARKDITVEVNPTSNLLIGHVPDLRHHPLWRLSPGPHRAESGTPPLSICVGSDDPLTFATTLPQEYQLLHDALVEDGATSAQALDWVDRVRRTGLQRSFTMERSDLNLLETIPVSTKELELPP